MIKTIIKTVKDFVDFPQQKKAKPSPIPKFVVPNPASPNLNGRMYNSNLFPREKMKMYFSSKEAFCLTEEEYLAFINKQVLVSVVVYLSAFSPKKEDFVSLEDFMEEFRPELFEKYKLLLEK